MGSPLRGNTRVLLKHGSCVKKAREAQLTKLLADIQALESQHKRTPVPLFGE